MLSPSLSRPLLAMLTKALPMLHPAGTYAVDIYRDRNVAMVSGSMQMFGSPENKTVEYVKYRLTVIFRDELDQSVMAKETFFNADCDEVLDWITEYALPRLGEGAKIRIHEYKFTI